MVQSNFKQWVGQDLHFHSF